MFRGRPAREPAPAECPGPAALPSSPPPSASSDAARPRKSPQRPPHLRRPETRRGRRLWPRPAPARSGRIPDLALYRLLARLGFAAPRGPVGGLGRHLAVARRAPSKVRNFQGFLAPWFAPENGICQGLASPLHRLDSNTLHQGRDGPMALEPSMVKAFPILTRAHLDFPSVILVVVMTRLRGVYSGRRALCTAPWSGETGARTVAPARGGAGGGRCYSARRLRSGRRT